MGALFPPLSNDQLEGLLAGVFVGLATGLLCGLVAGIGRGRLLDAVYRSVGGAAGGLVGGAIGGLVGWMAHPQNGYPLSWQILFAGACLFLGAVTGGTIGASALKRR